MNLPADYKRIETFYTRPERFWLWCCDRLIHFLPAWAFRWDDGLYFAIRAYTWSQIEIEREWATE